MKRLGKSLKLTILLASSSAWAVSTPTMIGPTPPTAPLSGSTYVVPSRAAKPIKKASVTVPATISAPAAVVAPAPKPWAIDVSLDQYLSHRDDVDAYTYVTATADWRFNPRHMVQIVQPVTKLYTVDAGNSEVLWGDTRLYHHWSFAKNVGRSGIDLTLRSGLWLPTSKATRDAGTNLTTAFRLAASRKFLGDRLVVAYRPSFAYNFNEYKSTVDGAPNAEYTLGHSLLLDWEFVRDLTFEGLANQSYSHRQASDYQQNGSVTSGGSYLFSVGLIYQINRYFAPHVTIEQTDSVYKEGRAEVVLYDPTNTRYIVGFDVTL